MKASLEHRAARAAELAQVYPAASDLLRFYRELVLFQEPVYEELRRSDQSDIGAVLDHFPELLDLVRRAGPEPLKKFGAEHLQSTAARQELLVAFWEDQAGSELASHEAGRFFARVLLQPYAEHIASRGRIDLEAASSKCPFCSARPVAGVLRGEGDGAKRGLLCSLCSTEWPFRRVLCPNCGEEDKDRLPIYTTPDFHHVRVDACDRCKTYIKSVDLTRDGHAVPVVDELATVALNVWVESRGYAKLESNLLGL